MVIVKKFASSLNKGRKWIGTKGSGMISRGAALLGWAWNSKGHIQVKLIAGFMALALFSFKAAQGTWALHSLHPLKLLWKFLASHMWGIGFIAIATVLLISILTSKKSGNKVASSTSVSQDSKVSSILVLGLICIVLLAFVKLNIMWTEDHREARRETIDAYIKTHVATPPAPSMEAGVGGILGRWLGLGKIPYDTIRVSRNDSASITLTSKDTIAVSFRDHLWSFYDTAKVAQRTVFYRGYRYDVFFLKSGTKEKVNFCSGELHGLKLFCPY